MIFNKILIFKMIFLLSLILLTIYFFSNSAQATDPEEFLKNPEKELRARNITKNIRCIVCQNQSIDESSAMLAKDLRLLIRKKISEDYTDEEIYEFLLERYGDFILLKPPLKLNTLILWFFPLILFMCAIFILYLFNKKSKK